MKNGQLWVVSGDLGYGLWDQIQQDYSSRFTNVGSAEQLLIGVGIGLAYEGYTPILYSITPFLLCRPYEMLRNYVNHEKIPIKMVGSGRDREYHNDGFTHHAEDADKILSTLENIQSFAPKNLIDLDDQFKKFLYSDQPCFMSLSKSVVVADDSRL
jgi:transketolase